ncbi:MAG: preprotein translocase subunit SecY [Aquificae bacterium]|nr:preprotein translocase subunit SecY [Aquificota bacterium]
MSEYLKAIFELKELRQKFLFTLLMFAIYRLGSHIPIPGVNPEALEDFLRTMQGSIFALYDIFSGGNLGRLTVFALGVMPYISASIMMQLLTVAIPHLQRLAKEEGDYGRYKINEYTKYLTLFVALIQSLGIAFWIRGQVSPKGIPVVENPGIGFILIAVLTLVAGTMFLVWIADRITEKGIGNGASLIIFAGIVAGFPNALIQFIEKVRTGDVGPLTVLFVVALIIGIIVAIVYIHEAERRIPIQYPGRQVGRQLYAGRRTYLPIKLNPAGVIPIIFAQALLLIPSTILNFIDHPFVRVFAQMLTPGSPFYNFLYVMLIVFFTYFYTAVLINPVELAENLHKAGAFIPGVRPGQDTVKYLERIINRLVFFGALFLSVIALIPILVSVWLNIPFYFGGTTALIVVGVALDTFRQIETYLLQKKYRSFVRR